MWGVRSMELIGLENWKNALHRVLILTPIRTGQASAVLAFLTSLWNIILSYFKLSSQILLPNCNITGALCGPFPEGGLDHSMTKANKHWRWRKESPLPHSSL